MASRCRVVGWAIIEHPSNGTVGRVDGVRRRVLRWIGAIRVRLVALRCIDVSKHIHLRPKITGGRLCWQHQVRFVYTEWLVNTAGSYVCNHGRQVRGELVLKIEVPLSNVIAIRMRFDVGGTQFVGADETGGDQGEREGRRWWITTRVGCP